MMLPCGGLRHRFTRCAVLDPTFSSRTVLVSPTPGLSEAWIEFSIFRSTFRRPIALPELVPHLRPGDGAFRYIHLSNSATRSTCETAPDRAPWWCWRLIVQGTGRSRHRSAHQASR